MTHSIETKQKAVALYKEYKNYKKVGQLIGACRNSVRQWCREAGLVTQRQVRSGPRDNEKYARVLYLKQQGLSDAIIATRLGIDRSTVRRWVKLR